MLGIRNKIFQNYSASQAASLKGETVLGSGPLFRGRILDPKC